MANDRLWFTCTSCHQHYLLYKYYPSGEGYVWPGDEKHLQEFEDFIEDHLESCYWPTISREKGESHRMFFYKTFLPFVLEPD